MNRIVGLETEYGCLTSDPAGPASAVGRVRNWIFERNRAYGLPDMHQRDWDEPAGNGGWGLGYAFSKGALHRIAGVLAVEQRDNNVQVFNVQPGFIATEGSRRRMVRPC